MAVCASPLTGQARDSVQETPARIIGVFDSQTGVPLEGVHVRDAFSGTYAVTTEAAGIVICTTCYWPFSSPLVLAAF